MKKLNVYDIGPESQLSNLTIIFKVYFRNLEFFEPYLFMVEGRSRNFLKRHLELTHIQYLVVLAYSFIGGKNGIFIAMYV
jgi:hypothetical protein